MKITKNSIKNIFRCIREMSMTMETAFLYMYYYAHQEESPSIKEIYKFTGLNPKTIRKHSEILEIHGVLKRGESKGRERRRMIKEVLQLPNETVPSIFSSIIHVVDIPSQKNYAQWVYSGKINNSKKEEEEGVRYESGIEGLKEAARNAVKTAIKSGKLERPKICSNCGKKCTPDAHHHKGYASLNWLDIVWLCHKCYGAADKEARKIRGKFSKFDILHDPDWKKAELILLKYFKRWEVDPTSLTRKRRFDVLMELLFDESVDFECYCKWYYKEKYDKGFNFGLFLFPSMIEEFKDMDDREGKYLKTSSRMATSESHKKGVADTKKFFETLQEDEG